MPFDLAEFIDKKWDWSRKTFGPGRRTEGIVDHIRKECVEILNSPDDPEEPIDVIFLALDMLSRSGYSGKQIIELLCSKHLKNLMREWPDWRTMSESEAIEHNRE